MPQVFPMRATVKRTWRTDQFGIGTLRVNAPTHSFAFWGPKLVWQITHAGWKVLRGSLETVAGHVTRIEGG